MKINKEGFHIITVTGIIAVVAYALVLTLAAPHIPVWISIAVGVLLLAMWIFVAAFFREPARPRLSDDKTIFSPCDGTVVVCEPVDETEYLGCRCMQVSVFMSITNVHINWFPISGRVEYFKYHQGKYLVAWHPKSSEDNERTTTVIDTPYGKVLMRQIAGLVARRIVSYATPGTQAVQNDKCGFIKFGSRVDLLLPLDTEILVKIGDKAVGSQTPIARLK